MNSAEQSQLLQFLHGRRDAIADSWHKAIARTSHVPHSAAEVRQHLVELTEQAIALLLTGPFDHGQAQAIGASLVDLRYVESEALGRTQEVLVQQLVEGLPADQVAALQLRLVALLGGVATGFLQQAREAILSEQERIRGALIRELRQVEEETLRLSSAVKTSVDGIVIMDAEGKITYVNEAALKMYGTDDKEDMVGRDGLDLIAPEQRERGLAGIGFVLEKGYDKSRGYDVITKDGSRIPVEMSAAVMKDADGKPIGIVNIVRDITERKRVEEALREAHDELEARVEERTAELAEANAALQAEIIERKQAEEALQRQEQEIRVIADNVPALFSYIDVDGRYCFVNKRYEEWFGLSGTEIIGKHYREVLGEATYELIKDRVEAVLSGHRVRFEEAVPYAHRGTRWVVADYVPDADDGGKVKGFFALVTDITERKRAEEALRRAHDELEWRVEERTADLSMANKQLKQEIEERKRVEEALQERERHLRTVVTGAPIVLFAVDREGVITLSEGRGLDAMGRKPGENVGRLVSDAFRDVSQLGENFRRALAGEEFTSVVELPEVTHETRYSPLRGQDGEIAGVIGVATDITERRRAEDQLLAYQERLRSLASELSLAKERERRRIATELHDRIGQSLAACKIKLGVLRASASSTGIAEPLNEIHELVDEIIQETRSLTFEVSSPILYELGLEAAVEWLAEQIQERHGILYDFEDDRQPKPIDGDIRVLLFQAVRELLTNVAKHAQAHSVKVSIGRDDSNIKITVEDDGIGFDMSETGSHWSRNEGFGLFSIRERLDYLGGRLEVESEPGRGTWATLTAPLKRDEVIAGEG
jgi:PAS domain S-box-containing protein